MRERAKRLCVSERAESVRIALLYVPKSFILLQGAALSQMCVCSHAQGKCIIVVSE